MANTTIQLRRSSVAGKLPNTSTLSIGELGLNLTDKKLYSSNGSAIFEPAANVTTLYVGNSSVYTTVDSTAFSGTANNASYLGGVAAASYVNTSASYTITGVHTHSANLIISSGSGISANGSFGTAGQVLTTNSSAVYWSTSSGSTGTIPVRQQYTGDGSNTVYTVTGGYVANSISVYLNGVMLRNGTEVTVTSGSTFTMATAPANGALIDVVGVSPLNSNGVNTVVNQQFTSNGTSNSFTITNGYISNSVAVFLNGVKQIPGTDVVITSGNTVNFAVTPANNYLVDVFGFSNPVALSSNVISVGNVSIGTGTIIVGNATVNSTLSSSSLYVQSVSTQPTINLNSSSSSVGNRPLMVFQTTNTALTQFFGGLLWSSTLVGGATTQSAQIIGLGSSSNSSGYIDLVAQTTGNGNFVVQTAGSGANSITSNSTGTYLLSNTLSVGTAVYHVANGNMGIACTSPTTPLDVTGNINTSGTLVMGSTFKRNRLINGNFEIWQRGTSETYISASYLADRWTCAGYQASRHSRQAASGTASGLYSRYCLQSASSTTSEAAGGTRCDVSQKIENLNCYDLAGRSITVSFWVKFSAATATSIANSGGSSFGSYCNVYLQYNTTTTDSASSTDTGDSNYQMINISNGSLPTTWTKYSFTTTVPAGTNNITFRAQFTGTGSTTVASTVWFQIAEVQLEPGTIATPYEKQIYGDQLFQCQRYYEVASFGGQQDFMSWSGGVSYFFGGTSFKVPKRRVPDMTYSSTTYYNYSGSTVSYTPNVYGASSDGFYVGYNAATNAAVPKTASGTWYANAEL